MQNYVNVLFNSDQIYVVKENAFLDIIKNVFANLKGIKLSSKPFLVFETDHSNLTICLDIKIKTTLKNNLYNIWKNLIKQIQVGIQNLIGVKPKNIQLIFSGFY
ncbi:hypothetical protein BCF59_0085 [Mycoplasmopsis mustelae]|uniref:Uncharacterized protein n=1 Tax=Mycoplasmopsis mustelae TaxID=171289 RepID=A0A4R7UCI1_9BACT|nr:hypothetical protein [Mycoplasmopsis mustelae]TDV24138.1 hypothetical protein BCF59_0085 [Mycoplasmopsis mustelae]